MLFFCVLLSGPVAAQNRPDEKPEELRGPIKSIRAESTSYENKSGKWVADGSRISEALYSPDKKILQHSFFDPDGSPIHKVSYSYSYDGNGKLIERKHYILGGILADVSVPQYNEKGELVRVDYKLEDGSVFSTHTHKYDNAGREVEDISHESGSEPFKRVNVYSDKGSLLETTSYKGAAPFKRITYTYRENGKLDKVVVHRIGERTEIEGARIYDLNGNMTEFISYGRDGSVELKEVSKYDERGNTTEESRHRGDGSLISRTTTVYEFDSHGNWTKKEAETILGDGKPSHKEVTRRLITYHEGIGSTPAVDNTEKRDVKRPRLLNNPRANYTRLAAANKVEGLVRVRVLIGEDGLVKQVIVIRGLPDGLNEEAVRAALLMKFEPAIIDGKPLKYWQAVDVEFKR
jgi:TonB family protein